MKDWVSQRTGDSRRAPRLTEREMVVNYWDGAAPAGRGLRDVSESGAYIHTKEKWYAGTIVRMIFRRSKPVPPTDGVPAAQPSINISAQVVRQDPDGVAMEFIFKTKRDREAFRSFLAAIPDQAAKPTAVPAPAAPVPAAPVEAAAVPVTPDPAVPVPAVGAAVAAESHHSPVLP